jgi:hypothetical protein
MGNDQSRPKVTLQGPPSDAEFGEATGDSAYAKFLQYISPMIHKSSDHLRKLAQPSEKFSKFLECEKRFLGHVRGEHLEDKGKREEKVVQVDEATDPLTEYAEQLVRQFNLGITAEDLLRDEEWSTDAQNYLHNYDALQEFPVDYEDPESYDQYRELATVTDIFRAASNGRALDLGDPSSDVTIGARDIPSLEWAAVEYSKRVNAFRDEHYVNNVHVTPEDLLKSAEWEVSAEFCKNAYDAMAGVLNNLKISQSDQILLVDCWASISPKGDEIRSTLVAASNRLEEARNASIRENFHFNQVRLANAELKKFAQSVIEAQESSIPVDDLVSDSIFRSRAYRYLTLVKELNVFLTAKHNGDHFSDHIKDLLISKWISIKAAVEPAYKSADYLLRYTHKIAEKINAEKGGSIPVTRTAPSASRDWMCEFKGYKDENSDTNELMHLRDIALKMEKRTGVPSSKLMNDSHWRKLAMDYVNAREFAMTNKRAQRYAQRLYLILSAESTGKRIYVYVERP